MGNMDKFPKPINKTVRYIKQEATREHLEEKSRKRLIMRSSVEMSQSGEI